MLLQEAEVTGHTVTKARAETVCIPYALVPGLDITSRAYIRAAQITTGVKHVQFSSTSPEDSKLLVF
jgi:hypothetical protein